MRNLPVNAVLHDFKIKSRVRIWFNRLFPGISWKTIPENDGNSEFLLSL